MQEWLIKYWHVQDDTSCVEKWFDHLSENQLKAITKELSMLQAWGNALKLPHSRALGHGLFELREHIFDLRMYYSFEPQQVIIIFAAGNKSTQEHDISLAYERLAHYKTSQQSTKGR